MSLVGFHHCSIEREECTSLRSYGYFFQISEDANLLHSRSARSATNIPGLSCFHGAKNHRLNGHVQQMVDWWFGARWFGIRIRVPLSNTPFHKGILGIQTTNFPIVDMQGCSTKNDFWEEHLLVHRIFPVIATQLMSTDVLLPTCKTAWNKALRPGKPTWTLHTMVWKILFLLSNSIWSMFQGFAKHLSSHPGQIIYVCKS